MSVTKTAEILGVRRATLSDLLNGKAALSPEMALRIEKAFDVSMDMLLRMQAWYDASRMAPPAPQRLACSPTRRPDRLRLPYDHTSIAAKPGEAMYVVISSSELKCGTQGTIRQGASRSRPYFGRKGAGVPEARRCPGRQRLQQDMGLRGLQGPGDLGYSHAIASLPQIPRGHQGLPSGGRSHLPGRAGRFQHLANGRPVEISGPI